MIALAPLSPLAGAGPAVLAALLIRALEERGRIAGGSARAALTAAWIPCPERLITPVS